MHEEIKARKKISELLESFESFERLRGMCLLFNKDSKYYKFSGFVTAALLDWEKENKIPITILAIDTKEIGWITFYRTREDLIDMFNNCDAFIGNTSEGSFLIEKE